MRKLYGIVLAAFVFIVLSGVAQASDLRGMWKVQASEHTTTWVVGLEGTSIYGTSVWDCCPGYRVDRITGVLEGDRVTIIRHIYEQGSPSGTQIYKGVMTGDKVTGSWQGLGGAGPWSAHIKKMNLFRQSPMPKGKKGPHGKKKKHD